MQYVNLHIMNALRFVEEEANHNLNNCKFLIMTNRQSVIKTSDHYTEVFFKYLDLLLDILTPRVMFSYSADNVMIGIAVRKVWLFKLNLR
jgi:hypothetical protein